MIQDGALSPKHRICMDPTGGLATAAIIGGTLLSAGATGYSIHQSNKQAELAEKATDAQANEQKRIREQLAEKQRQEEATNASKEARERLRSQASGLGRKQTQLTGPLGLPQDYFPTAALGGGK